MNLSVEDALYAFNIEIKKSWCFLKIDIKNVIFFSTYQAFTSLDQSEARILQSPLLERERERERERENLQYAI